MQGRFSLEDSHHFFDRSLPEFCQGASRVSSRVR